MKCFIEIGLTFYDELYIEDLIIFVEIKNSKVIQKIIQIASVYNSIWNYYIMKRKQ